MTTFDYVPKSQLSRYNFRLCHNFNIDIFLGWLFKVELSDESEVKKLMSEDQYKEFLKTQESH